MKRYAVRNLRMCTKDCLCLFVCPTGATDTENSVIDKTKCIGCGACTDACPAKAISLVPYAYPPQQPKTPQVIAALHYLGRNKASAESAALRLAEGAGDGMYRLMKGIAASERILGADLMREAGYMLPQSENTRAFLQNIQHDPDYADLPADTVNRLLELLYPDDTE